MYQFLLILTIKNLFFKFSYQRLLSECHFCILSSPEWREKRLINQGDSGGGGWSRQGTAIKMSCGMHSQRIFGWRRGWRWLFSDWKVFSMINCHKLKTIVSTDYCLTGGVNEKSAQK